MSGIGIFIVVLVVLVIFGSIAWIGFTQLRARRQGLPPPSLASYNPFANRSSSRNYPSTSSSGALGWFSAKFQALKNRRTAGGAYEEPLGGSGGGGAGGRGRRGFGPLDPDEAWDTRVGTEADAYGPGGFYEEQELGLHPRENAGPYSASGYGGASPGVGPSLPEYGDEDAARGRSRGREAGAYIGGSQRGLDERYDEEMGRGPRDNPFGDAAERSDLRGVSPRPIEMDATSHNRQPNLGAHDDSPTERKSMFREDM
ncbi:hypothetical protein MMC16_004517 [Acarospora aff. strigata]|nr:hypothetical protein [Acarospora aff. strigata]